MNNINRYDFKLSLDPKDPESGKLTLSGGPVKRDDGNWVEYADYAKDVARLRKALESCKIAFVSLYGLDEDSRMVGMISRVLGVAAEGECADCDMCAGTGLIEKWVSGEVVDVACHKCSAPEEER